MTAKPAIQLKGFGKRETLDDGEAGNPNLFFLINYGKVEFLG
jgi:hypothetical protein